MLEWDRDYTGAYTLSDDGNNKLTVINNIASGAWHHGFHYTPLKCDTSCSTPETEVTCFRNNTAHSISGYGAIAKNVEHNCAEVKDFRAYKCTEATIHIGGNSKKNQATNIISIDSVYGISVNGAKDTEEVVIKDSTIFGEYDKNKDCSLVPNG